MNRSNQSVQPNDTHTKKSEVDKIIHDIDNFINSTCFHAREELVNGSSTTKYYPWICVVCDIFIEPGTQTYISKNELETLEFLLPTLEDLPTEVKSYYTYNGPGTSDLLQEKMLSPNGCFLQKHAYHGECFAVCKKCKHSIQTKQQIPECAIANGFEIGNEPNELRELSDVELAFISPIRCHTHLLTFKGGHKGITGFHSLLKTNLVKKKAALHQLQVVKEIPERVTVLLHGGMTEAQKKQILHKCKIRPQVCQKAIEWLLKHNILVRRDWDEENQRLELDKLPEPLILDESSTIETIDTNIESKMEITVVFPDSTLDIRNGGYKTVDEFKKIVDDFRNTFFTAHLSLPKSDFVKDFEEDNFVKAFVRNFPFGIGGPNTKRVLQQRGQIGKMNTENYFRHVTNLSNLRFQEPLFILVSFNIFQRSRMLKSASRRVKSDHSFQNRASQAQANIPNLAPPVVLEEIARRNNGIWDKKPQNSTAREFLNSIKVVSGVLPHTDEAAKKGRKDLFSMQIKFGTPDVFFTVSPADDNSFVISVCGDIDQDSLPNLLDCSLEELNERASRRSQVRFAFPGLSTLYFELVLKLVMKHVVGWKSQSPGYFGPPKAYFFSVEEQARKVLHVHMLIWLKEKPYKKSLLQTGNPKEIKKFCKHVDSIVSNKLISDRPLKLLDHPCKDIRYVAPCVQVNQVLRNIRHKEGCKAHRGSICYCPKCGFEWTSDDLAMNHATLYLFPTPRKSRQIRSDPKWNKKLLSEYVWDQRRPNKSQQGILKKRKLNAMACNALYNNHSSFHVRTCFRENCPECRYRFPQLSSSKTKLDYSDHEVDWHNETGRAAKRRLIEVLPKRGKYDVCMNNFCPPISESKIHCNSNVAPIIGGVQAFYITKYSTKNNQKEEAQDYEPMAQFVQKRLAERKYQNDSSEHLSRVIGASLAHNSKNVISATLAKFLINNPSRFQMSHTTNYVPVSELKSMLNSEQLMSFLSSTVVQENQTQRVVKHFLTGTSYHYLKRPNLLEDVCLHDFCVKYEVHNNSYKHRKQGDEPEQFLFTEDHPAYKYQHVKLRTAEVVAGITNWEFVDTKSFGGDILDMNPSQTNNQIEDYCLSVLVLFHPFRTINDLKCSGSHLQKLQEVWPNISEEKKIMLRNIQDIRNAARSRRDRYDPLEMETEAYHGETNSEDKEEQDDPDIIDEQFNAYLLSKCFTSDNYGTTDNPDSTPVVMDETNKPVSLSLVALRDKGSYCCGYQNLANHKLPQLEEPFLEIEAPTNNTNQPTMVPKTIIEDSRSVSLEQLHRVILSAKKRKVGGEIQSDQEQPNSTTNGSNTQPTNSADSLPTKVYANGKAKSLIQWSIQSGFDDDQRKAFCIIMSHFILTYFDDLKLDQKLPAALRREKTRLKTMAGKKDRLRMFLDGAGGSGTSHVIREVLKYAEQFCGYLEMPFTQHTILVTAYSGVAATSINGNTIHASLGLDIGNQKNHVDDAQRSLFGQVRLIIMDEISMMDCSCLRNVDSKLRDLSEITNSYYGDYNIVFVGDFCQLEPVNNSSQSIYKNWEIPQWGDAINVYIECKGMWRFRDDPEWGFILRRFRQGQLLPKDFNLINRRVVNSWNITKDGDSLPENLDYCTPTNKDRDAINAATFQHITETNPTQALMIFSDHLGLKLNDKDTTYSSLWEGNFFWGDCGESDCKFYNRSTRMDPVLKVYPNCQMMLTENKDVINALANGSTYTLKKVMLKSGCEPFLVSVDGVEVKSVFASQVSHVVVEHNQTKNLMKIAPQKFSNFKAKIPHPNSIKDDTKNRIAVAMTATQIPLVITKATTCHKLQGCTKKYLFINSFWHSKNWPYVALSRVTKRSGLFLRKKLDVSKDYQVDYRLTEMQNHFKETCTLPSSNYNPNQKWLAQ